VLGKFFYLYLIVDIYSRKIITWEVEYVPEVGVRRLREKFGGWRDMERDEVIAADELLQRMLPEGET
jgi:hypothetical protein